MAQKIGQYYGVTISRPSLPASILLLHTGKRDAGGQPSGKQGSDTAPIAG